MEFFLGIVSTIIALSKQRMRDVQAFLRKCYYFKISDSKNALTIKLYRLLQSFFLLPVVSCTFCGFSWKFGKFCKSQRKIDIIFKIDIFFSCRTVHNNDNKTEILGKSSKDGFNIFESTTSLWPQKYSVFVLQSDFGLTHLSLLYFKTLLCFPVRLSISLDFFSEFKVKSSFNS